MPIEFRRNGRKMSADRFFKGVLDDAVAEALQAKEEEMHGVAASIVDPETGEKADVITRRTRDAILLTTTGSPAFARELERRLGLSEGEVAVTNAENPVVYLAHASEDKDVLARPIAEFLMTNGIDVWFDEWEISGGDSLRQKMDAGLEGCTHFLVLLTPTSITKPWVNAEIDAGFADGLSERVRFMGVRSGVEVSEVPPLLRTRLLPPIDADNPESLEALVGDIFEKSRKPPLGEKPRYVTSRPAGLEAWSPAAATLAEYVVKTSETGCKFDPQLRQSDLIDDIDLSADELDDALQDLEDAGLIERSGTMGSDGFWPTIGLFVEFDPYFMPFDPTQDAKGVAARLGECGEVALEIGPFHQEHYPDWSVRRLNSSLNRLEELKAVNPQHTLGCAPYTYALLIVTQRTRRYARQAE